MNKNFFSKAGVRVISTLALCSAIATVQAAQPQVISPTEGMVSGESYIPGAEPQVAAGEMRVVVLGSGLLPVGMEQAASCFMVELGNSDKFLFDVGSQCHSRIAAQKIPYNYIDKLFLSRLHADNFADLPSFWLGGTVMNRVTPLRIWGPSGKTEELGTQSAMDTMHEMYAWDRATRGGVIDARGMVLDINEFDHRQDNQVIYEDNGVVIRSFSSAGELAGSVGYGLEWKGLKFAYAGSVNASQAWIDYAKGADVAIHEAQDFGQVMAQVQPRLAIAANFHNDAVSAKQLRQEIGKTYQGSLALGADYLTVNASLGDIRVRMGVEDPEVWPLPSTIPKIGEPNKLYLVKLLTSYSQAAVLPMTDIVVPIYEELNEEHGTDYYPISSSFVVKTIKNLRTFGRAITFSDPAKQ